MKYIIQTFLLILLMSNYSFSQDIYIAGNLSKDDCEKIKRLSNAICNNFKPKIVNIYFNSKQSAFTYQRKNINRDALLDDALKSLSQSKIKENATKTETTPTKAEIIDSYKNKRRLVTFDKQGADSPPSSFNDFEKLINYINDPANKKGKFVFQIIIIKDKPIVTINSPQNNKTTNLKMVEGVASGTDPISEIQVRVNKGKWQKADGTTSWTIEVPMQNDSKNTIEAIAIDSKNDTSEIKTISDVTYKIVTIKVDYRYPIQTSNVAYKCMLNLNHYFSFKFHTNYPIERDKLNIVIENSEEKEVYQSSLNDLSEGTFVENQRGEDSYDYCVFLIYSVLGVEDPCKIISDNNYYYHYTTKDTDKIKLPKSKILVHFESFDSKENSYEPCNCD